MFRKMRRIKQQLTDDQTSEILKNGKTGILAVMGDEGYPYTVPINYVYAEGKIYLHCAKTGHKIDAIRANDKVSFCVIEKDDIVPEKLTTFFKSAVVFGRARILEDREEIISAVTKLGLKYNNAPDFVKAEVQKEMPALCCIEITIEHMTGKQAIELVKR